jgi:hypothetical protein
MIQKSHTRAIWLAKIEKEGSSEINRLKLEGNFQLYKAIIWSNY